MPFNTSLTTQTIMKNHIPTDVQKEINAGKAMFERALDAGPIDENHERILETLEDIIVKIDDEQKVVDKYVFDAAEFIEACDNIIDDQLSALRKDKINVTEFSTRFNRWFVFCDAVVNLGISCLYSKDALQDKDYEAVFKTLKINKAFESSFLKPRGIKIAMRHKSKQVMEKYPWLAMPVLIISDANGVEHQIAITPSQNARVWWLDILAGFHGSYNWVQNESIADYEEGDEEVNTIANATRFEAADTIEAPKDYVVHRNDDLYDALKQATKVAEPGIKKQSWWKRMWNRFTSWFK